MNGRSKRQLGIADEGQWHSVLGQCDDQSVPALDAEHLATQVRQRHRRRVRRRLFVGGGISAILLLAAVARPAWHRTAVSPQAVEPPGLARLETTNERNTAHADNTPAEVSVEELDSVMAQLRSELEALRDAERSAEARRRLADAASRVADQIRQQAEISVLSTPIRSDPSTS